MGDVSVKDLVRYVEGLRQKGKEGTLLPPLPKGVRIQKFSEVKMVTKPWGFEMWLAHGAEIPYALKMLYIKEGTKTSLQYHNQKREHNVVFSGTMRLHYKDEKTGKIVAQTFSEGNVIEVLPPAIHRVEAVTDLFLIEVSSPHLDDVVRVEDDYQRPDGKIESEHRQTKL